MVAALWSNPNYDDTKDSKGHRQNAVEGINDDFNETLQAIEVAFSARVVPDEEKLSKDNPFFAAAERGLEKVEQQAGEKRGNYRRPSAEEERDYQEIDQA